jgi:hypothetical protein
MVVWKWEKSVQCAIKLNFLFILSEKRDQIRQLVQIFIFVPVTGTYVVKVGTGTTYIFLKFWDHKNRLTTTFRDRTKFVFKKPKHRHRQGLLTPLAYIQFRWVCHYLWLKMLHATARSKRFACVSIYIYICTVLYTGIKENKNCCAFDWSIERTLWPNYMRGRENEPNLCNMFENLY